MKTEQHSSEPESNSGNPKRAAIVLIRGWSNSRKKRVRAQMVDGFPAAFLKFVRELFPAAEIIHPRLPLGVFSTAEPNDLVDLIITDVTARFAAKPFDELIIIGFSAGTILARSVYATACGAVAKANDTLNPEAAAPWASKVSRMVLLAGVTRGWELSSATPAGLRFIAKLGLLWLNRWARLRHGRASFIEQIKRGAPFVVETRLKLLQVELAVAAGTWASLPHTVLLLGSQDEFVSPADAMDLGPRDDCSYIEVPQSSHMSIFDICANMLSGSDSKLSANARADAARRRASLIRRALIDDPDDLADVAMHADDIDDYSDPMDRLGQSGFSAPLGSRRDIDQVVFVIHGIRDSGFWTKRIAREIKQLGHQRTLVIRAPSPSYGFFSMWDFVNPWGRRDATYWFLERYAEVKRLWPEAQVSYIGHSNGTYLAANALEICSMVAFERVVFAGSVVRTDYAWSDRGERVGKVLNLIATADMVVAALPGAFERLGLRRLNVGGAGVEGFSDLHPGDQGTRVDNFKFVAGGHGAAIEEPMWQDLARYVVDGTRPAQHEQNTKSLSGKISAAICKRFLEHGDTDHILGSPSQDLEILAQPAKSTEPSESALNHPTFRKDSPSVFDFGGNVQDESECLVDKFHGCPAITRIAGKRLDARVFLRRTRHHGTTRHGIAAIGCVDRHMQQVAEDIDYDMAFMPFDLLAAVDPAFFARVLGLDALRVDNPVTRRCRATVVLAMECI
jgi:hypothetical protein